MRGKQLFAATPFLSSGTEASGVSSEHLVEYDDQLVSLNLLDEEAVMIFDRCGDGLDEADWEFGYNSLWYCHSCCAFCQ